MSEISSGCSTPCRQRPTTARDESADRDEKRRQPRNGRRPLAGWSSHLVARWRPIIAARAAKSDRTNRLRKAIIVGNSQENPFRFGSSLNCTETQLEIVISSLLSFISIAANCGHCYWKWEFNCFRCWRRFSNFTNHEHRRCWKLKNAQRGCCRRFDECNSFIHISVHQ